MKRKLALTTACIILGGGAAVAQTQYDATRLGVEELNGTARFVGMGGAMSALGADISTIGTNPAGIGLFRGHDFSLTFGMNANRTNSDFAGSTAKEDRTRASFDQIGFVYSSRIGSRTSLRYFNLAFNYHKSRNFNRLLTAGGMLDGLSQTQQMANMMGGAAMSISEVDDIYNYGESDYPNLRNPYLDEGYPYLGVMGVRTGLVGVGQDTQTGEQYLIGWGGDANGYRSREEGGIEEYDFNASFNIEDRMYFGITVGAMNVNYRRSTYYTEDLFDGNHSGYYEMQNVMHTDGSGINVKLGAIIRPIEDSPFRFGVAIHTPTWYSLTDTYSSSIYSELNYAGTDNQGQPETTTFRANEYTGDYVGDVVQDYELVTPWKFNLSMGTILGGIMALDAEYEYADYSTSKLKYDDGVPMDNQNSYTKEDLKAVHTFRIGMETRLSSSVSLRAGYNYTSAAYEEGAYKALNYNDMRTDTEYCNDFARNTLAVGLGYRGKWLYADIAYKYDTYKSDFYAFSADDLQATKVTNDRHQLLFTLGVHF